MKGRCKMAIVSKVFYVNGDSVEQMIEIAPSKRAITKKYETEGKEILKQINITEQYAFTIEDVLAGNLSAEQKELLSYVLADAGVPANNEVTEDGNENNND